MKNLLFILLFFSFQIHGQVAEKEKELRTQKADTLNGWKTGGMLTLTYSQVSLVNWAAGGQNSMSGTGFVNLFANFLHNNFSWDNNLDLGYGLIQQADAPWIKNEDKIDFSSKFGKRAFSNLYYAGLLNFKSQFASGYNYPNDSVVISEFLSPGYILVALGIDFKKQDKISFFLAPLTGRMTIVQNQFLADAGAFGVEKAEVDEFGKIIKKGENMRNEFGGYLKFMYKENIMKNITFQTKLELFSNYLKNPQNVDVNWENLITLKVNKFISATISSQLIYDDDIAIAVDTNNDGQPDATGPRTQFKEVLGIGFAYKF